MNASEVKGFFESACGDCGHSAAYEFEEGICWDDDTKAKLEAAQKNGVTDLGGWYADVLFSDKDFMSDLLGDHVFGMKNEREIVEELAKDSHYREWATDFLKRHEKRLAGQVGTIMWKEVGR